ncbi:sensor histidine kinase [Streptomyces sp. RKAG290]|uniref:ATP-binding protein n=1 Tax=Streptomyces sp. RKAG290 TaxID=2888348 RepID=UPI002033F989|nr:sensor histidine kinase [Streptomyces sp. RKAG290]MCM2413314.1 sensor histidine kinase [Streptomyces sp. RKAG290]
MTQILVVLLASAAAGAALAAAPLLLRARRLTAALHAERDAALRARDAVALERDAVARDREAVVRERDAVARDRDTVVRERDIAAHERDTAAHERDKVAHERDTAVGEAAQLAAGQQALVEETRHLVGTRLPALTMHLAHRHVPVPGLLHSAFTGTGTDQAHREVLDHLSRTVTAERHRVDEAAQTVVRGATTVIQALSHQMRSKIDEMQHRYDDPGLAQDLLGLDHLNEQNLRHIQGTGVLCGAWPGLTHADSHLGDIVAGAQSRIRGYHRVQVTSQMDIPVAVVARAVEPIAITVAELLANSIHHTHGTLAIDVSLHQVESGACIVIDDAGVGMHADETEFATRLLSGQRSILLTELGDPPRTGFAKISRLMHQYGFSVSMDKPSPYGGVRAVVFIPGNLLTLLDEETHPMSAMAPLPRPAAPPRTTTLPRRTSPARAAALPSADAAGVTGTDEAADAVGIEATGRTSDTVGIEEADRAADAEGTEEALPRRRRRDRRPTGELPAARPDNALTPEETQATWTAFQAGTASGRAASQIDHPEGNH